MSGPFLDFGSNGRRARRRGWSLRLLWPWWALDWIDALVYWMVVGVYVVGAGFVLAMVVAAVLL